MLSLNLCPQSTAYDNFKLARTCGAPPCDACGPMTIVGASLEYLFSFAIYIASRSLDMCWRVVFSCLMLEVSRVARFVGFINVFKSLTTFCNSR